MAISLKQLGRIEADFAHLSSDWLKNRARTLTLLEETTSAEICEIELARRAIQQ
jgi:hypothetical protein